MTAATTALRGEGVVYIDTSNAFTAQRLVGMLRAVTNAQAVSPSEQTFYGPIPNACSLPGAEAGMVGWLGWGGEVKDDAWGDGGQGCSHDQRRLAFD